MGLPMQGPERPASLCHTCTQSSSDMSMEVAIRSLFKNALLGQAWLLTHIAVLLCKKDTQQVDETTATEASSYLSSPMQPLRQSLGGCAAI